MKPNPASRLFCRAALAALCLFAGIGLTRADDGPMGVERIARFVPLGYQSPPADRDDAVRWVQVDLGAARKIDRVKLFPMVDWGANGQGFPIRFRLEASDDPKFGASTLIVDHTQADYPNPNDAVGVFPDGATGRYLRLTVTRLRDKQFSLSKLEAWSGAKDMAEGRLVSDSTRGNLGATALTRAPRPQGEEVVTNNPGNVIPAAKWKPVAEQVHTPTTGVHLDNGLFRTAMGNNIGYLLSSFSVDEMLRPFRERAGKPVPPNLRNPIPFWDTDLPGSNAGRFLMGAGNTLRWIDHPELRRRMNQLVDGIADCRRPNGDIMAYPENTIFYSERGAYTRSWLTHGLIEAGYAGNPKAFPLLRGYYDWFDSSPYLPELLRRGGQGVQGMIPNTRTFFSPIGKPRDIQVVQQYFQENYWLDQLARREDRAIWQYPYDHPHNYLITSLEPYLDQYRATGAKKYLDGSLGGWELYHDNWEHVGGSIAICEGDSYPPKSYYLHKHTGELCGSVFWVRFNQRFQHLYPNEEKYVGEIEKSIYNVGLANQVGAKGIRYHANLAGRKDISNGLCNNTCCEGQGTRLFGSLPEYIYSTAKDGVYVNLFAASSIRWGQSGHALQLKMATQFPFRSAVRLTLTTAAPTRAVLHVRVPAWAARPMPILVNGVLAARGKPGTFVALDRAWRTGDAVTFTLPTMFKLTRYTGAEAIPGQERYALEYGPILMAVVGPMSEAQGARLPLSPQSLAKSLRPMPGQPLHFAIAGDAAHQYVPYWQVADEVFTCYPMVGVPGPSETLGADDLALRSRGATATSDSEYAKEPGGTAKVIDGLIAEPGDQSHRWHSSLETPHPHWIEAKLPRPATIGRVVIRFADPQGHPTSFQGIMRVQGHDHVIFDVKNYADQYVYRARIAPTTTDTFRLVIRASANPAYPNAAQISTIELYPSASPP